MKFCQKKKKVELLAILGSYNMGIFFKKKILEGSKFYMTISIAFGFILEFCLGGMQKLECCVSDPRLARCQEVVLTASWVALWIIYPFVADCFTREWVCMASMRPTMVRWDFDGIEDSEEDKRLICCLRAAIWADLRRGHCAELGCFWHHALYI